MSGPFSQEKREKRKRGAIAGVEVEKCRIVRGQIRGRGRRNADHRKPKRVTNSG